MLSLWKIAPLPLLHNTRRWISPFNGASRLYLKHATKRQSRGKTPALRLISTSQIKMQEYFSPARRLKKKKFGVQCYVFPWVVSSKPRYSSHLWQEAGSTEIFLPVLFCSQRSEVYLLLQKEIEHSTEKMSDRSNLHACSMKVLLVEKWAANLMKTTQIQTRICSIEWALPGKRIICKI